MGTLTPPPLTLTMARPVRLGVGTEIDQAVDTAVCAFFLSAVGLGVDQRDCPPLELVFVTPGQVARPVIVGQFEIKY